jgi:DNA-binding NarL/FixJ family response regulator
VNARASSDASSPPGGNDRLAHPRVLIVDDDPAFRTLVRELLTRSGFDVVGEAGDAAEALAEHSRSHPTIALVDVQLPGPDGFEVARRLAEQGVPPKVVLTSNRDRSAYRRRLAGSPVCGFIAKADLAGPALSELIG